MTVILMKLVHVVLVVIVAIQSIYAKTNLVLLATPIRVMSGKNMELHVVMIGIVHGRVVLTMVGSVRKKQMETVPRCLAHTILTALAVKLVMSVIVDGVALVKREKTMRDVISVIDRHVPPLTAIL